MSNLIAKNYNYKLLYKAPLPFLGQKRNWIRYLPELLQGNLFDKGFSDYKSGIFVDMFGGSGLLSHNIKQIFPNAEVIYNDFDGYTDYLNEECVNISKEVGRKVADIYSKYDKDYVGRLKHFHEKYIFKLLNYYRNKYRNKFYDNLIFSFTLFSAHNGKSLEQKRLCKSFYKKNARSLEIFSTNQINKDCQNYLDNLTITKGVDFKELIQQYKDNKNAVFICDPPYLNTCTGNYKSSFDKNKFDFLVENIRPPFIAFSSMKNNLKELLLAKFPNAKYKEHNVYLGNRKDKSLPTTTDQMIWCVN